MKSRAPWWIPVAAALVLGCVAWVVVAHPMVVLAVVAVTGVVGGLVVRRIVATSPAVAAARGREAELRRASERRQAFAPLKRSLHGLRAEVVRDEAKQAAGQIEALLKLFANVEQTVNQKFSPDELTYGRYLGTAQRVFEGAVRHLEGLVRFLETREGLVKAGSDVEEGEARSAEILADIDLALASLARVDTELNSIRTGEEGKGAPLEHLIEQLEELADRAHLYSSEPMPEARGVRRSVPQPQR